MQAFKLVAPVFGALALVPLYLFAREVGGKKVALFSAAILAFLPAFIFRTSSGFYRGDAFALFFMVTGFLLFIKGFAGGKREAFLYYVAAGISLAAMALVWNGFIFGMVVLSAFLVTYSLTEYVRGRSTGRAIWGYVIAAGLCMAAVKGSLLVQPSSYASIFVKDLSYLYVAAIVLPLFLELLGRVIKTRRLLSIVLLAVLCIILTLNFAPEMVDRLFAGYGLVKAENPVTQTIRELQPATLDFLWGQYSLLLPFSLFGAIILVIELWKRASAEKLLLLVWILSSLYLLVNAKRFVFLASMPLAVAGGIFLEGLERYLYQTRLQKNEIVAKGIILILLVPVAVAGVSFASELRPHMSEGWYTALRFLEGQEEGAVLCWWDYGSWIQGVTGLPTTLDTVHGQSLGGMRVIANILLEKNQSKTLEKLQRYHVKYVIMPSEMVLQMPNLNAILNVTPTPPDYIFFEYAGTAEIEGVKTDIYGKSADKRFLVSNTNDLTYIEAGKPYSIRKVYYWGEGGLLLRDYSGSQSPILEGGVFLTQDQALYISPRVADTLLSSLILLNGYGFDAYELIFANPEVRIYAVRYNHAWVDISTDRSVYREGEEVELKASIDSSDPFRGSLTVDVYDSNNTLQIHKGQEVMENKEYTFKFHLNESFVPGRCNLYATLFDSENKRIESLQRPFWIR